MLSQSVMSHPDDSLVVGESADARGGARIQVLEPSVVVKCPQCRETTQAASLNSLRKNYQLIDMLKLFETVQKFLTNKIVESDQETKKQHERRSQKDQNQS